MNGPGAIGGPCSPVTEFDIPSEIGITFPGDYIFVSALREGLGLELRMGVASQMRAV